MRWNQRSFWPDVGGAVWKRRSLIHWGFMVVGFRMAAAMASFSDRFRAGAAELSASEAGGALWHPEAGRF